eukprot:TRINITY_DN1955_c0_g1_i1.p1 TRINITY_DN1955_c0_g1~~TRINITY_DN1955_c0_g1_i1.p1  ORF type:complete len:218 (+),score=59.04 TRINITY_DN1955_c0_g1_i1:217-870(+)
MSLSATSRLSQLVRSAQPTFSRSLFNASQPSGLLLARRNYTTEETQAVERKNGNQQQHQQQQIQRGGHGRRELGHRHRRHWDPFRDFFGDDFYSAFSLPTLTSAIPNTWTPSVDISETEKEFTIHAELPGVKKEDLKLQIDDDVLTVQGERKFEKVEEGREFRKRERSYGSFARTFQLPEGVDQESIKASFKDGVLEVSIPKAQEQKPKGRTIEVEA